MHKHHANGALQFIEHSHYTAGGREFWGFVLVIALLFAVWALSRRRRPRQDYR